MDEAIASSRLDWLLPQADSLGDFVFFRLILSYLRDAIADFGIGLMGRSMQWVGGIALTLLTLWILVQGYRIVTGQSRNAMMALVTNSLRAVLILTAATTMAMFGSDLHEFLNEDLRDVIHHVVTGEDESPEDNIDESLAWMQVAFSSIDGLDVMGDPVVDREKTQALWFVGLGTGGPAITAGTMLLLYEIALALFIDFGPLFILCLLFDQTKALFEKWLLYGIGTLFSMAVLSAMVSIALEMVMRVAAAFWGTALTGSLLGSDFTDGMTSVAMQQGGLGLILTLLIISTPPMAAAFFNGALGQFMPFSAFGGGGAGRRNASGGGYAGGHQEASQEFHPAQHYFRQAKMVEADLDQVKRASFAEPSDFLARYPNALASNAAAGGATPINLWPAVAIGMPDATYVDTDGYIQGAGITKHEVAALEKGTIIGPEAIVLHRTDSSTAEGALTSFARGIGTHFLIDKDGTIYQAASLDHKTAHVGKIKSRCYEEGTCSAAEAATIKKMGFSPTGIYHHEQIKKYPSRYPMNEDSIGIETVALHLKSGWEDPTAAQSASIERLIRILQDQYGLSDNDIYEHDKISYKTLGEGADLFISDATDVPIVPIRLPPP